MRGSLKSLFGLAGRTNAIEESERWVVVDTETSGIDPEHDQLLGIGGVAVDATGISLGDSFEIILRGEAFGDAANILVHGIGHGAQARGVPAAQALRAYRDWVAGARLVGFHAEFDRAVLRNAFAGAGIQAPDAPWLDLSPLAAALVPEACRYGGRSLDDWLAAFGIECMIRHNAAADALATAELLLCLRALAAKQGARGYAALVKAARQKKWLAGGGDD